MLLLSFKVSFLPVTSMHNSCLAATHAKQLPWDRVLSSCRLSTCWTPPVLTELLLPERAAMAHPPCTNWRNCWDLQVSVGLTWHLCLAWPNACRHSGSCSPWNSPATFAIERVLIRQRLLAWVQHHSDGALLWLMSKPHRCPQLAVLLPATHALLPCPKSEGRIRTHSQGMWESLVL